MDEKRLTIATWNDLCNYVQEHADDPYILVPRKISGKRATKDNAKKPIKDVTSITFGIQECTGCKYAGNECVDDATDN